VPSKKISSNKEYLFFSIVVKNTLGFITNSFFFSTYVKLISS
jgi:hypothetical protein